MWTSFQLNLLFLLIATVLSMDIKIQDNDIKINNKLPNEQLD